MSRYLTAVTAFICTLGVLPQELNHGACPAEWVQREDNCYRAFARRDVTLKQSKDLCSQEGAMLVTIDTAAVNALVYNLSKNMVIERQGVFIGLTDVFQEGTFVWENGSPVSFSNWETQPNNYRGLESCVEMWHGGAWNDYPCDALRFQVICEKHLNGSHSCPPTWTKFEQKCFASIARPGNNPVTWSQAGDICRNNAAKLPVIHSAEANEIVRDLAKNLPFVHGTIGIPIGLKYRSSNGTFVWEDGTMTKFTQWEAQPDNFGGKENCVEMWLGGKWNDCNCDKPRRGYVCQKLAMIPDQPPAATSTRPGSLRRVKVSTMAKNEESSTISLSTMFNTATPTFMADASKQTTTAVPEHVIPDNKPTTTSTRPGSKRQVKVSTMATNEDSSTISLSMMSNTDTPTFVTDASTQTTTVVRQHGACPAEWVQREDNCYRAFVRNVTWAQSRHLCSQEGAMLVKIDTSAVNALVYNLSKNMVVERKGVFIGLTDISQEGVFVWEDRSRASFTNWETQPNNYRGQESCVEMWYGGAWNDYPCDAGRYGVICEKHLNGSHACPPSWIEFGQKCFGSVARPGNNPVTWSQARDICRNNAAKLPVIHSANANRIVHNLAQEFINGTLGVPIGLKDRSHNGTFVWEDGKRTTFTQWEVQPDNFGLNENCVEMWLGGKWNDCSCGRSRYGYVCQKRAMNPDQASLRKVKVSTMTENEKSSTSLTMYNTATPTLMPNAATQTTTDDSQHGVLYGIVAGIVAMVCLTVLLGICCTVWYRRRRNSKRSAENTDGGEMRNEETVPNQTGYVNIPPAHENERSSSGPDQYEALRLKNSVAYETISDGGEMRNEETVPNQTGYVNIPPGHENETSSSGPDQYEALRLKNSVAYETISDVTEYLHLAGEDTNSRKSVLPPVYLSPVATKDNTRHTYLIPMG